jgi:Na+/proline symporter
MDRTFLLEMRSNSAYPTFRGFVGLATAIGYLAALGVAVFAALGGFRSGNVTTVVWGCCIAILVGVVVAIARELSLMVADIADAIISMASKQVDASSSSSAQRQDYVDKNDLAALVRNRGSVP